MMQKRLVYLLVVFTLFASTGRSAASGPNRLPTVRENTITEPVVAPTIIASTLALGTVNLTLFSQGFPTDAMPPAGWIVQTANITETWRTVDATDSITTSTYVHSGRYAAWVQWIAEPQDEWLYSPPIIIPLSLTDAKLSFWALTDTSFRTATVAVYAISASGTITTELWNLVDEAWPQYYYRLVQCDLTPFLGQTIRLAWRYYGYDGQSFGLDDIDISGNAEGIWIPIVANQK